MQHGRAGPGDERSRTGAHLRLGRDGEARVADWYESRGGAVLARNWRCRHGELDLVVSLDGQTVFCEVKTRSSSRYGSPFEAVDRHRVKRLRSAAMQYLRTTKQPRRPIRFDVAAVLGERIEVRTGVF